MSEIPKNGPGYGLLIYPTTTRWPTASDPTNRVEVEYTLIFKERSGGTLLKASATGKADSVEYDLKRLLECRNSNWETLKNAYMTALAEAQANAIASLFSQAEVNNFLRGYATKAKG